jgi:hypothetical protein
MCGRQLFTPVKLQQPGHRRRPPRRRREHRHRTVYGMLATASRHVRLLSGRVADSAACRPGPGIPALRHPTERNRHTTDSNHRHPVRKRPYTRRRSQASAEVAASWPGMLPARLVVSEQDGGRNRQAAPASATDRPLQGGHLGDGGRLAGFQASIRRRAGASARLPLGAGPRGTARIAHGECGDR